MQQRVAIAQALRMRPKVRDGRTGHPERRGSKVVADYQIKKAPPASGRRVQELGKKGSTGMAFELRALIASKEILETVAARLPGSRVADLAEGLGVLALSAKAEGAMKPADRAPVLDGLRLGARVAQLARDASMAGH